MTIKNTELSSTIASLKQQQELSVLKSRLYDAMMNILNGLSIGIIVPLIPGALLNASLKYLLPFFPQVQIILTMTAIAQTLLPAISAACVGMVAKFTPIQTTSLSLVACVGAGNYHIAEHGLSVVGSGDVINVALTITVGYLIILLFGNLLKAYTILLVPTLVLIIAGGIGLLTYKPISLITHYIGKAIQSMTTVQPLIMGFAIGAVFALIIVSPISSVGIASAISLSGIGAGSANLGIAAAGFGLAIYGRKVNSFGSCLAHILGSPKLQMANLFTCPKLLLPILINAGIMGGLGAIFNIQATPATTGFGCVGMVGPIAAFESLGNFHFQSVIMVVSLFIVVPALLGFVSDYICCQLLNFHQAEFYKLTYL